ncbi:hypothetical protein AB0A76_00860 [Streptomyces exfoliatus]|uniref:Uncharacterized protein n=1 Tax=Streptomyces exfoliatus TaxID=1905 RepID=A0ABV3CNH6_STREX
MPAREQPRVMHARAVPYRSSACRIGTHGECAQPDPAEAPVGIPVIYEACACACHTAVDHGSPREVTR